MRSPFPSPSNARFVLVSITAASVFYAPTVAFGNSSADARAALQRVLVIQGTPAAADASATAATGSAGSQAGVLAAEARAQLTKHQELRQSLQSMQSAARAAAQAAASSVPNGLADGGLQVATGATAGSSLWSGAGMPAQQAANGLTTVTIEQTDAQAMLTWNTFNIGRETSLKFDQSRGGASQGQWIAFNKIVDPSGNPTRILGSINAPGQVYVINPNGVIFSGTAQVNTRTLVASALPINDSLVARGLLNNPDTQFLFTGLAVNGGSQTNAFTPPAPTAASGRYGDVLVEAGAILNSPSNADKSGGRVALIGANVTNAGTITTPDGQAILAAGLQVGLEASTDPTLRGLNAYVGNVGTYAGTATNSGLIDSARGAVTIVGKTVNQTGLVGATTSVSRNGRIDLLAQYDSLGSGGFSGLPVFFPRSTGQVEIGDNSINQILLELDSTEKITGTELALKSQFNVRGLTIHLGDNASVLAPAATVNLDAGHWNLRNPGSSATVNEFVYDGGQIYLDAGATVNVAGSAGVTASVADNIIEVSLRGDELANSPLQRDGALRGQTIQVDVLQTGTYNGTTWVGTPLADVSGYVKLVERNIGQLTTNGGTVSLRAGGSAVIRSGASINVSGGYIDYQGGSVETTKLVSNGVFYDISKATPDLVYDGIYTGVFTPHTDTAKWGAAAAESRQSRNRLLTQSYEPGFTQGGSAGQLTIQAPSVALDSNLKGTSVSGRRQIATPAANGGLTLNLQGQYSDGNGGFLTDSRTPPTVRFGGVASLPAPQDFALDVQGSPLALESRRQAEVVVPDQWISEGGLGSITVYNPEGDVVIGETGPFVLKEGGQLTATGRNVTVAGDVTAKGGKVALTATAVSLGAINAAGSNPLNAEPGRGNLALDDGARIDVSGEIQKDSIATEGDPLFTKGGTISLTGYNLILPTGSKLDASAGTYLPVTGRPSWGNGGTISLLSGQDPRRSEAIGGRLEFGATLAGYSGATGGNLILRAPQVQIGGATGDSGVTLLSADFFQQGGFASYDIRGIGKALPGDTYATAVRVAAGTELRPRVLTAELVSDVTAPDGLKLTYKLNDEGVRAPASMKLRADGVGDGPGVTMQVRGEVRVEQGASIRVDPRGKIELAGDVIHVAGDLIAPGGGITLAGATDSDKISPIPTPAPITTVDIKSGVRISAAGAVVYQPDPTGRGLRTGKVLDGGSIDISGNIVAGSGAIIDVSGSSATLDLAGGYSGRTSRTPGVIEVATQVDSSGGKVSLAGSQQLVSDATFKGDAGGASANGGKLTLGSGVYKEASGTPATVEEPSLLVTQSTATTPDVTRGNIDADKLNSSGFADIALKGTVKFVGPVSLVVARELTLADSGVLYGDNQVQVDAHRVKLGTALVNPRLSDVDNIRAFYDGNAPLSLAPTYGSGSFTATADQLIDVGNVVFKGLGAASLLAAGGDIRGSGTLDIAGDLTLRAGQIYPPSATIFSLNAYDYQSGGITRAGSITVQAGDAVRSLPYSVGGTLNLNASTLVQNGTLRAPFGGINLGRNGTGTAPVDLITGQAVPTAKTLTLGSAGVTSVSGVDPETGRALILPYGAYINGNSWVDPQGRDITSTGSPAKQVVVSAQKVTTETGSRVDINGGGDLVAARFKSGTGGKQDILASSGSFAIIPGYQADYAPFAPFNESVNGRELLGSEAGYVNSTLNVGDRIHIEASPGLPAGDYTLLPARYAVLPDAVLVTPKTGTPAAQAYTKPDQAVYVSGYRFNAGSTTPQAAPLRTLLEVAGASVIAKRATYETVGANAFFSANALSRDVAAPRLPRDAGQVVFTATLGMALRGDITGTAGANGRGGQIDIDSPVSIRIAAPGATGLAGELVLDASLLSAFDGASVLLGGRRVATADGTRVDVSTGNIVVDNASSPLLGADIILAAKNRITLADGSRIIQSGSLDGIAESLFTGSAGTAGSGDGALLRVSSDATIGFERFGVSAASSAQLSVGANVDIVGGKALILDSSGTAAIDGSARFGAESLALNSGRISLQLTDPGTLQPNAGLILTQGAIAGLQNSSLRLTMSSYSTIDVYGTGTVGSAQFERLTLKSPTVRGFNAGGGNVTFQAQTIELLGLSSTAPAAVVPNAGDVVFAAKTLRLGGGSLALNQYQNVSLNASDELVFADHGTLSSGGNLTVNTPLITAETAANHAVTSSGLMRLNASGAASTAVTASGLGAKLGFTGGTGLAVDTAIRLPSGRLELRATSGDLSIGENAAAVLDVGGSSRLIGNSTVITDAGSMALKADTGNIRLGAAGTLALSAPSAGGDAGVLAVSAAQGAFSAEGQLLGRAGIDGVGGKFEQDVATSGGLTALDAKLDAGGFYADRSHRIRTGDVVYGGSARSSDYRLSVDGGDLDFSGSINASGATGGRIRLFSSGSLSVLAGATLDASAARFDNAGKGGRIELGAGSAIAGVTDPGAMLTLAAGSIVDLTVDSANAVEDARLGRATGTLHLRASRTLAGTDLALAPIAADIRGASDVVIEGFKVQDLTPVSGTDATLNASVRNTVLASAALFGNSDTAIRDRVAAGLTGTQVSVRPGIEIINRTGDITLSGIWDLSTARYGSAAAYADKQPGVLSLRAAGDVIFPYVASGSASLSDGFGSGVTAITTTANLWNATLLPSGSKSWSYQLVAGSDFASANVMTRNQQSVRVSSVKIGSGAPNFSEVSVTSRDNSTQGVPRYYQVIRTGTGDIAVAAKTNIEFSNNLATLYTAGTKAQSIANFDVPNTYYEDNVVGPRQYSTAVGPYAAQYSYGGGNIDLQAGADILHTILGLPDSSKQMPSNWLYRRGNVDSATGEFASLTNSPASRFDVADERLSTSWWIDFNNFFEGVATLGGGNIDLNAGNNVTNVDALIPTNARMPAGRPDANALVELGGGDLTVRAGGNIDGGVYYVERGVGSLTAGDSIKTNYTRSTLPRETLNRATTAANTWLPTTLFVGKGTFDVSANNDVTLGSVTNPFLLPGGVNNSYYLKSYFSTYSEDAGLFAISLTGDLNVRGRLSLVPENGGYLYDWYANILLRTTPTTRTSAGFNQPWLRLVETNITPFQSFFTYQPPVFVASAPSGDVNLVGQFNFTPSAKSDVRVVAQGSINGTNQVWYDPVTRTNRWASARINISDADPDRLPGVTSPLALSVSVPDGASLNYVRQQLVTSSLTNNRLLTVPVITAFDESGSYTGLTYGRLQTKQALHAVDSVHADSSQAVVFDAGEGDISGLTLFTPKQTEINAGRDITDVAFYLQNLHDEDVTTITAGRDIILYNETAPSRLLAGGTGNGLLRTSLLYPAPGTGNPNAGDLQINGPGTLNITAGRDFDLGSLPNVVPPDATAVGLTSIGNARNLYLPDTGADVVIGVGVGDGAKIDHSAFAAAFLNPATAGANATRYLPVLGELIGLSGSDNSAVWSAYSTFSAGDRARLTLAMFNRVLRDAGRDHNNPDAAGFGTYAAGYAAINKLFPGSDWQGNLRLSSRELRTSADGDVVIYAPGGGVNLGSEVSASQTPPGIITERGGDISIFTRDDVDIGTQRIFTLRGGDILIWSSTGNIAAGSSSTTLQSASPTRVLVDPQSGDVKTDLAGLATGGGIGVLAAVEGVPAGDVDLIAPVGTIDAGDAGIRSAGNINIAALVVLNSANISAGGATSGTPTIAAPNIAGLSVAASASAAGNAATTDVGAQAGKSANTGTALPSLVTIEVLGYGGGDSNKDEDDSKRPTDGA